VSAARISALEARLADVEKRHAEAIARLSNLVAERAREEFDVATSRHAETDQACLVIDALVPEASNLVFEEWVNERDEKNISEFGHLKGVLTERLAVGIASLNGETIEASKARIAKAIAAKGAS